MGWNATIVVLNDYLGSIERDPEFGKKLAAAISEQHMTRQPFDLAHGVTVVEQHHANDTSIVAVGGNTGTLLGYAAGYTHGKPEDKLRILRALADEYGYNLAKKRQSPARSSKRK